MFLQKFLITKNVKDSSKFHICQNTLRGVMRDYTWIHTIFVFHLHFLVNPLSPPFFVLSVKSLSVLMNI